MLSRIGLFLGCLTIAIFFVIGIITLPHYGVDWDTINHLPRGQAYLRYFLTGELTYKKLPTYVDYYQKDNTLFYSPNTPKDLVPKRSFYQINFYDASYFLKKDGGHPPLSDIVSSIFNLILFQKMGLINDIDSYHVYVVLMATLLSASIFLWTRKHFGNFAALVAILSLNLYPLFLGESHFNLKDIPQTTFYGLMLIFLYEGITRKRKYLLILSAVFFGCAWGTKFNILFAPFIVIPWFILYVKQNIKSIGQIKWLIWPLIFFPIIALAIFGGSWPYLWRDPISNFLSVVKYYKTIGINPSFDPAFIHLGFNTYGIEWLLYTTPLITLFLALIGIVYTLTLGLKEENKTSLLILLWFIVPILRVSMPNAGIYGGVRQIMEYIPAMAILSGIGAGYMVTRLHGYMAKRLRPLNHLAIQLLQLLVLLSFFPITLKLISIHPNENVYFNPLIGGLKGAKVREIPYWGNSFGNAYRQGVRWINANAEKDAKLVLAQELMPNLPNILVRRDIAFTNTLRSGFLKNGEYIIGLEFGSEFNRTYYSSIYYARSLEPIKQIIIDDTSILNIWKNDISHTKKNYQKEEKLTNISPTLKGDEIEIDLGKPLVLSRIQWIYNLKNCQPLEEMYFQTSLDGYIRVRAPHTLPDEKAIPLLGEQPSNDSIIFPFPSQQARFIYIRLTPTDSCLRNMINPVVYYLPDVTKQEKLF